MTPEAISRDEWERAKRGGFTTSMAGVRMAIRGTAGVDGRFVPVEVKGMKAPAYTPCAHPQSLRIQNGPHTICGVCISRLDAPTLDELQQDLVYGLGVA